LKINNCGQPERKEISMTGEKFAEIVTHRAHERVQKKIKTFAREIDAALDKLTGTHWITDSKTNPKGNVCLIVLQRIVETQRTNFTDGWPKVLWEMEEKAVKEQVLSMMDEIEAARDFMQKAHLAPGPGEGDAEPE
jgi:hypothetical protein